MRKPPIFPVLIIPGYSNISLDMIKRVTSNPYQIHNRDKARKALLAFFLSAWQKRTIMTRGPVNSAV
jgi:hypothetical protein